MEHAQPIRRTLPYTLPLRLIATRRAAELSQADMALRLGVARSTLVRWELGEMVPKRQTVSAWALATGYDAEWLWTGDDPDSGPNPAFTQHYRQHSRLAEVPRPRILSAA